MCQEGKTLLCSFSVITSQEFTLWKYYCRAEVAMETASFMSTYALMAVASLFIIYMMGYKRKFKATVYVRHVKALFFLLSSKALT